MLFHVQMLCRVGLGKKMLVNGKWVWGMRKP